MARAEVHVGEFGTIMALAGVFFPLFGLAVTFLGAWTCGPGPLRWLVLVAGPALVFLVYAGLFEVVGAVGHMLAVVILLGFVCFLLVYYPALLVVAVLVRMRTGRTS